MQAGAPREPQIVPFRGAYLRLRQEPRHLVRSIIYPSPTRGCRSWESTSHATPTATRLSARPRCLRAARRLPPAPGSPTRAGRHADVAGDAADDPALLRTAITEIAHAVNRGAMAATAARYVPERTADDLLPGLAGAAPGAGTRRQARGRLRVLRDGPRAAHAQRAVAAATSSLAIGRHVADPAKEAFALVR